ncbi:hypothetical protein D1BOALGB6SA_9399, partial [Olavius sp. associated proteobacterium Delta 1]
SGSAYRRWTDFQLSGNIRTTDLQLTQKRFVPILKQMS